jgi:hypothetical protein
MEVMQHDRDVVQFTVEKRADALLRILLTTVPHDVLALSHPSSAFHGSRAPPTHRPDGSAPAFG